MLKYRKYRKGGEKTVAIASKDQYSQIASWMERDFPQSERPPMKRLMKLLKKGVYKCYLYESGKQAYSYAVIAADEELGAALISYFAVMPESRSKGIGSESLSLMLGMLGPLPAIIEAEDPGHSMSEEDRGTRLRRLEFYKRLGFNAIPVHYSLFGVEMNILWRGPMAPLDIKAVIMGFYKRLAPETYIGKIIIG